MFFGLRSYCFLICVLMVSSARAGFILNIDLSTVNQVTISATTELSAASTTGSDNRTGVYLKDFFAAGAPGSFDENSFAGNSLVYFKATSDGSPAIRNPGTDTGLNIYSMDNFSPDEMFTTGVQAFKGSATWNLTPTLYASFLLAPTNGDVYAMANESGDLTGSPEGPQVIGQYSVSGISAVPEPTSMAIFGLGGLGMVYLARRKRKV
jgi:hypothetical protein